MVSAVFLLVFVALVLGRAADDNSLFSWSWVFERADASLIYLLLTAGLILAVFLSRVTFPEHLDARVLAVLSCAASLPFWTEPELIVDASRYFTQAKQLEVYGPAYFLREWGRSVFAWTDLPLIPFCYGILFKLFGESRMVIQAFTTLLFSLTAVLTFHIGRTLWDRETGLAAGLLLLGMPYLLTQVPLVLVDVPVMFLLMLSLAAFLAALERGGMWIVGAAVSLVLFALSKYSAWTMASLFVVALIVRSMVPGRPHDRRLLLRGALTLVSAAAMLAAILVTRYDVLLAQLVLLGQYQAPGLGRWSESHVSTFLFQVHPIITVFALVSAVVAIRKRDSQYLIASWLLLLVALFGIRRIRYVLPAFPLLALMASYGLQTIRDGALRRFIVLGVASTSLVIAVGAYLPFARSMGAVNLQHAGEFLDSLDTAEVTVIAAPSKISEVDPLVSVILLDLFTAKNVRYADSRREDPSPFDIDQSSLRFTWEFPTPAYYLRPHLPGPGSPVVVLMNKETGGVEALDSAGLIGYRRAASFTSSEGIFHYAPVAEVFVRADLPRSGSTNKMHRTGADE